MADRARRAWNERMLWDPRPALNLPCTGADAEVRQGHSTSTESLTVGLRVSVSFLALLRSRSQRIPLREIARMRSLNRLSNLSPLLHTAVPTYIGEHCDHGGTPVTHMENRWCFNGLAGGRWLRLAASTVSCVLSGHVTAPLVRVVEAVRGGFACGRQGRTPCTETSGRVGALVVNARALKQGAGGH